MLKATILAPRRHVQMYGLGSVCCHYGDDSWTSIAQYKHVGFLGIVMLAVKRLARENAWAWRGLLGVSWISSLGFIHQRMSGKYRNWTVLKQKSFWN